MLALRTVVIVRVKGVGHLLVAGVEDWLDLLKYAEEVLGGFLSGEKHLVFFLVKVLILHIIEALATRGSGPWRFQVVLTAALEKIILIFVAVKVSSWSCRSHGLSRLMLLCLCLRFRRYLLKVAHFNWRLLWMSMQAGITLARFACKQSLVAILERCVGDSLLATLAVLLEVHSHSRLRLILTLVNLRNLLIATEHVIELLFTLRLLTCWDTSVTPAAMFRRICSDSCLTLAMAGKSLTTFAKVMRFLGA